MPMPMPMPTSMPLPRGFDSSRMFFSAGELPPTYRQLPTKAIISILWFWISEDSTQCPVKLNIQSKGWNFHVHRGFPRNIESTNLNRDNLSREIGRTAWSCMFMGNSWVWLNQDLLFCGWASLNIQATFQQIQPILYYTILYITLHILIHSYIRICIYTSIYNHIYIHILKRLSKHLVYTMVGNSLPNSDSKLWKRRDKKLYGALRETALCLFQTPHCYYYYCYYYY